VRIICRLDAAAAARDDQVPGDVPFAAPAPGRAATPTTAGGGGEIAPAAAAAAHDAPAPEHGAAHAAAVATWDEWRLQYRRALPFLFAGGASVHAAVVAAWDDVAPTVAVVPGRVNTVLIRGTFVVIAAPIFRAAYDLLFMLILCFRMWVQKDH
jgi:hypothetical protein